MFDNTFLYSLIIICILVIGLIAYFVPYRKLKDKIFKRLIPLPVNLLTSIVYRNSSFVLELQKNKNSWTIAGSDWDANKEKINRFTIFLQNMQVFERIAKYDNEKEFGIGSRGSFILYYGKRAFEIMVGNNDPEKPEHLYIKASGDPDLLIVSSTLLSFVPVDQNYYSDSLIFSAYYTHIKSIEAIYKPNIEDANTLQHFSLVKTTSGWVFGKKTLENFQAQELLDKILAYEVSGFAEETALPNKPNVIINMRIGQGMITRYFFSANNPEFYIMPSRGRLLYVRKEIIQEIFSFTPRSIEEINAEKEGTGLANVGFANM